MVDLRLALEGAFEGTISALDLSASAPSRQVWPGFPPLVLASLASLLVGGSLVWLALGNGADQRPTSPQRFVLTLPASDILPRGFGTLVSFSPDGRTIVYVAQRDGSPRLFRRPISEFEATPITNTEGGTHPVISLDGDLPPMVVPVLMRELDTFLRSQARPA